MTVRRRVAVVAAAALACLLGTASCGGGGYDDARDAYQQTSDERAAADRKLRAEADELSVTKLGTPTTGSAARCQARPARGFGADHTVGCRAQRWVVYRGGTASTADDALWTAERSAVRAVVDGLDKAGWDRAEWGDQLDQSLANRSYDPYPVFNGTEAKQPVSAEVYLVDRSWHEPSTADADATRITTQLDDESGFLVAVVFEQTYLTEADCPDCADRTPTAWPSQ